MIQEVLSKAISLLKNGEILAAPTETVYGLFADATNDDAIQKIYKTKGRPSCNPLIVHVSDLKMARKYAQIDEDQEKLINYFWNEKKAPITFILKSKKNNISKFVTAGLDTIALRCPNHPIPLALIQSFEKGLAAPSANTSTSISPTSFEMVKSDLGEKLPLIIDGGICDVGIESTILDISEIPYRILRHGGTTLSIIKDFLGSREVFDGPKDESIIKAPGMMKKHYSPSIPVRLNASFAKQKEAFIGFGKTNVKCDFNLSESGNLKEAAHNLFYALKKFDDPSKYNSIAIMPIPNIDIGTGINDRILRASAS